MGGERCLSVVKANQEGPCESQEQASSATARDQTGGPFPERLPIASHETKEFSLCWRYSEGGGRLAVMR